MLKVLCVTTSGFFGGADKNYIRFYRLLKDQDWLNIIFIVGNEYTYKQLKEEGADVFLLKRYDMNNRFIKLKEYKNRGIEIESLIELAKPDFLIFGDGVFIPENLNFKKIIYIQSKDGLPIVFLSRIQDNFEYAIVVSQPLYEFAKNFIDEKKLILIPNWIEDIEQVPKRFEDVKEFKVGWVSRLTKAKGWEDLVEAFKNTDIKVYFIGTGPDMGRAKIIEKEYKNFAFLGFLHEPKKYLKENASVYVFPSKNPGETFGLSLLEAMSVGIPCIAYKTDVTEYVLGADGLFYETVDELRELVFRLKEDKDFYNERARYSLERAKMFSKEQAKEKFIKLFKSLEETKEAIQ